MNLPLPKIRAFGTPKRNNNNNNNKKINSHGTPKRKRNNNNRGNRRLKRQPVEYITSDNFRKVLQPMTDFVNTTTAKFAFTGSGAIALYAIFGHINHINNNSSNSKNFYGARVPNDIDIGSKFYSQGSANEYSNFVLYNTIQGQEGMNRRQMIKENQNKNIHLMSGNTKIVYLKIYDIDYPVVTIQFLLDKIDEYGNNKPIRRTINKPSLNKMTNSGRFLQNTTKTLSTGETPPKQSRRRRNNNNNNSLF